MIVQAKKVLTGGQDCYVRRVAAEMEGVEGGGLAKKKEEMHYSLKGTRLGLRIAGACGRDLTLLSLFCD